MLVTAKLAILAILIYWIVRSFGKSDWDSLVSQEKNWLYLVVALVFILLANLVSFVRWYLFVRALDVPFTVLDSIRLGFLGYLFNFISFGAVGGDLFKAIAAAKRSPGKRPEVVASVLVDRAIGLLGLVLVAAVFLEINRHTYTSVRMHWIRNGAWMVGGVGLVSLASMVVAGSRVPFGLLEKLPVIGKPLHRMSKSAAVFYGKPWLVITLVLTSCVVHSILTASMFMISHSLYSQAPTLQEHFLTVPPAFAAAALPLTPGGIGLQEMAVATMFKELPSLPTGFNGAPVAIMYRLLLVAIAAIGGIFYISSPPENRDMHSEST